MATEVLRPHNILLPQRIRRHQKPQHKPNANPSASSKPLRKSPPPPPVSRKPASYPSAAKKMTAETTRKEIYAGPAFSVSPEPSSLPLPQFPVKKDVPVDDAATRDLRRMLRLE